MGFQLTQTVGHRVWYAGTKDARGNPVDQWQSAVDLDVYGYGPPAVRAETEPGGTQVVSHLEVYAPTFTVDPRDRFVIAGVTYEVSGEPGIWDTGPFGYEPGMVVRLKKVSGGR